MSGQFTKLLCISRFLYDKSKRRGRKAVGPARAKQGLQRRVAKHIGISKGCLVVERVLVERETGGAASRKQNEDNETLLHHNSSN